MNADLVWCVSSHHKIREQGQVSRRHPQAALSCWSDESRYTVDGLMAHAEALTAITCPTVNSYIGLVPRVGGFEGGPEVGDRLTYLLVI